MARSRFWLALVTLASMPVLAAAEQGSTKSPEEMEGDRKFAGINFGVGISATIDTGSRDRVTEAVIDANGIVRVNKMENVRARVMLEAHSFIFEKDRPNGKRRGSGPFVALQPGTDEIIDAIGLGWMWGFKRTELSDGSSFNIGFGFAVDPSITVLGDEFVENMAAPKDPMGNPIPIRLQTRDQGGILVLGSFSWR